MIKAFALALIVISTVALAQSPRPYAGMERRAIKSLSDQQIADLQTGRGMGFALPAELNGYPGPAHVLEHAAELGLSPDQVRRTQALFDAMKAEAVPVGQRLIEQETRLDHLFATHQITPASLTTATDEIGTTQAQLRRTHLKYHLAMMDVLSAEQIAHYRELRGYGAGETHHPHMHH